MKEVARVRGLAEKEWELHGLKSILEMELNGLVIIIIGKGKGDSKISGLSN